jgi:ElaB/YqjD/DUF883 family membrane-anchored ribosome-binding protein
MIATARSSTTIPGSWKHPTGGQRPLAVEQNQYWREVNAMANQPASENLTPDTGNSDMSRAGAPNSRIEAGAERFKQGTTQAVETAKRKFDSAADRVEEGLHSATDASARAAIRAAEKAAEARERSRALAGDASERASDMLQTVREFVRERPAQSLAIALAAGWVLGRVLGGRR